MRLYNKGTFWIIFHFKVPRTHKNQITNCYSYVIYNLYKYFFKLYNGLPLYIKKIFFNSLPAQTIKHRPRLSPWANTGQGGKSKVLLSFKGQGWDSLARSRDTVYIPNTLLGNEFCWSQRRGKESLDILTHVYSHCWENPKPHPIWWFVKKKKFLGMHSSKRWLQH